MNLCRDCKYLMQAKGSMLCGHKDANMSEKGNGHYVYPPMDWTCDCGKFSVSDRRTKSQSEEMAIVAKENGWSLVKGETMIYERIELFGAQKSRGSFDDFFAPERYDSIEQAWAKDDYVTCDYVKDQEGIKYIEVRHSKNPDIRKYHKLNYQNPFAGLDVSDDRAACDLSHHFLLSDH